MKPVDVKTNTCIDSSKEINDKDPKFKLGGTVRISKYKSVFAKVYTPKLSEEVFVIKKVKKQRTVEMLLMILMEKKLLEYSAEKNSKKQFKKSLELKK